MVEEINCRIEGINEETVEKIIRKNRLIKTAKTSTKLVTVFIVTLFLLNNFAAMAQNSENTQEIDVENDLPWTHTWAAQEQVNICLKNVNTQKNLLLKFENPITSELLVNNEVFDTIENGTTNIFILVINNATPLNFQADAGMKLTIENIPGARINCNNTRITGWTFQNQYGKYVSEIGIPADSAHEIILTPLFYPSLWPFQIQPPHIRPKPLPITYTGLINNSISTYGIAGSETIETLQKGTDCLKLVSDKPTRFALTITPKHVEPVDYVIYENGNATLTLDKELFWEMLEQETISLNPYNVSHDLKMAIQQLDKAYKETGKDKYENTNIWLNRAVNNITYLYKDLDERHISMKYQAQMIIEYLNGIGNITVDTKDMVLHRINKSMDYLSNMFLYIYNPSIRVKPMREKLENAMDILGNKNTGSLDDVINDLNKTISLLDYRYLDEDDENNIMIQQPIFILYWLEMTRRNIDAIVENENINGVNGAVNLLQNVIDDLQGVVDAPISDEGITAIIEELENIDYNNPPSGIEGILNMLENFLEHLDDNDANIKRLEKIEERLKSIEDDYDGDNCNVSFFQDEINQTIKELNRILVTINGVPVGFDVQTGYVLEDNDNDDVPKVTISLSDVWLKYQPSKLFVTVDGCRKININHDYSIAFVKNSTIVIGDIDDNNADIPSIHPETINIGNVSYVFNLFDEDLDGFPVVVISIHDVKLVRHLEIIIIGEYGVSSTDKKGYISIDGFKPHPIVVEYYEEEITETEYLYESLESSDRNAAVPNPVADLDHDKLGNIGEAFMYRTDALDSDTDKDSFLDGDEVFYWNDLCRIYQDNNLKPNADIDNDGIPNILDVDSDNDGLIDGNEFLYKTLPFDNDADNDFIMDGAEINYWENIVCLTVNETVEYIHNPDVDNELLDGVELRDYFTYPFLIDSDDDTLTDKTEVDGWDVTITYMDASTFIYHILSWPTYYDTDSDGLNDSYEFSLKTDPQKTDTDNDQLNDMGEVDGSWFISDPTMQDTDFDMLSDYEEKTGWVITVNSKIFRVYSHPQYRDFDRDMLDDYQEKQYGINPFSADTDSDNLTDKKEIDGWGIVVNGAVTHVNSSACDKYSDNDNLDDWVEFRTQRTDPRNPDTDNDNLLDSDEVVVEHLLYGRISISYVAYPNIADCDNDGVLDGNEKSWNVDSDFDGLINALDKDSDNDGLNDGVEQNIGTNPTFKDSDNDNLNDKEEYEFWESITAGLSSVDSDNDGLINILDPDSDNDGLLDGYERWYWGCLDNDGDGVINILDFDSDNDGLSDGEEINVYNTNPLRADTDDDGLSDYGELFVYKINPSLNPSDPDSDHDGINDGDEIAYWENRGLSDNDVVKFTLTFDSDNDGIPDGWEIANSYDPCSVSSGNLSAYLGEDCDNDDLTNALEEEYGTNPFSNDTDGDDLKDGEEFMFWSGIGLDPLSDYDEDGLANIVDSDSDNDSLMDGEEKDYFNRRAVENITHGPGGDYDNDSLVNIIDPDSDNDGLLDGEERAFVDILALEDILKFNNSENKTRYLKIPLLNGTPVPVDNVSVFLDALPGGWCEDMLWSEEQILTVPLYTVQSAVGVNGNNVHTVWSEYRDGNWSIYYKRSTDNGVTWTSEVNLSSPTGPSDIWWRINPTINPTIAVNGNTIHVAWFTFAYAGGGPPPAEYKWSGGIYYTVSTDNGNTWLQQRKLVNIPSGCCSPMAFPKLAVNGEVVHLVWGYWYETSAYWWDWWGYHSYQRDYAGVSYKRSTNNGDTWGETISLDYAGGRPYIRYPDIAVTGSNVYVAWCNWEGESSSQIKFTRSENGGESWGDPIIINLYDSSSSVCLGAVWGNIGWYSGIWRINCCGGFQYVDIATYGNDIHVVWKAVEGATTAPVYYTKSSDCGITWMNKTTLSTGYNQVAEIGVMGNTVHVVGVDASVYYSGWFQKYTGKVWHMKSVDGGNSWASKTYIGNISGCVPVLKELSMIVNDDGSVHVVWSNSSQYLGQGSCWDLHYIHGEEPPSTTNISIAVGDEVILRWRYTTGSTSSTIAYGADEVQQYLLSSSDIDDRVLDNLISVPITFHAERGVFYVYVKVNVGGYEHVTDPLNPDSDNDSLLDGEEVHTWHTSPVKNDTDEDGLDDKEELDYWQSQNIDPLTTNPDNDKYINLLIDADSDNDNLLDGEEINTYSTNPLNPDCDADGLLDGIEVNGWDIMINNETIHVTSNPLNQYSDIDGLDDKKEFDYKTNPGNPDTDSDNLNDDLEVNSWYLYSNIPAENFYESYSAKYEDNALVLKNTGDVKYSLLIRENGIYRLTARARSGFMCLIIKSDDWLDSRSYDLSDSWCDKGFTTYLSYGLYDIVIRNMYTTYVDYLKVEKLGCNPLCNDSDGDGLTDSYEVSSNPYVTSPVTMDSDGDGLYDPKELSLVDDESGRRFDPTNPDMDSDGVLDSEDLQPWDYSSNQDNWDLGWGVTPAYSMRFEKRFSIFTEKATPPSDSQVINKVKDVMNVSLGISKESFDVTVGYVGEDVALSHNGFTFYQYLYNVSFVNNQDIDISYSHTVFDYPLESNIDQSIVVQFYVNPGADRYYESDNGYCVPGFNVGVYKNTNFADDTSFIFRNTFRAKPLTNQKYGYEVEIRIPKEYAVQDSVVVDLSPLWVQAGPEQKRTVGFDYSYENNFRYGWHTETNINLQPIDPVDISVASVAWKKDLYAYSVLLKKWVNMTEIENIIPSDIQNYSCGFYNFTNETTGVVYTVYVFNHGNATSEDYGVFNSTVNGSSSINVTADVIVGVDEFDVLGVRSSIDDSFSNSWWSYVSQSEDVGVISKGIDSIHTMAEVYVAHVLKNAGTGGVYRSYVDAGVPVCAASGDSIFKIVKCPGNEYGAIQTTTGSWGGRSFVTVEKSERNVFGSWEKLQSAGIVGKGKISPETAAKIKLGLKAVGIGAIAVFTAYECIIAVQHGDYVRAVISVGEGFIAGAGVWIEFEHVIMQIGAFKWTITGFAVAAAAICAIESIFYVGMYFSTDSPVMKQYYAERAIGFGIDVVLWIVAWPIELIYSLGVLVAWAIGWDISGYETFGIALVSFFQHVFGWETAEEKIEQERQHYVALCWLFDYIIKPMNEAEQSALYIRNWEA